MMMIILTEDDADKVRGLTAAGHALAPVPLADGTFALPEATLIDHAHAVHRAFLGSLSRRAIAPCVDDVNGTIIDHGEWETDPAEIKAADFQLDWRIGEKANLPGKALTDSDPTTPLEKE